MADIPKVGRKTVNDVFPMDNTTPSTFLWGNRRNYRARNTTSLLSCAFHEPFFLVLQSPHIDPIVSMIIGKFSTASLPFKVACKSLCTITSAYLHTRRVAKTSKAKEKKVMGGWVCCVEMRMLTFSCCSKRYYILTNGTCKMCVLGDVQCKMCPQMFLDLTSGNVVGRLHWRFQQLCHTLKDNCIILITSCQRI